MSPNPEDLSGTDDYDGEPLSVKLLWFDVKSALGELPGWERAFHIFFLLGPFFLLIERTPADIWLSLIALIFAARAFVRRDFTWLRVAWVRLAFLFWMACLTSAAMSPLPSYSLGEAFAWFRFPLFAMAVSFWLASDRRVLHAMLITTAIGMMIMCGILLLEMSIEGQKGGRLTWPYGDLVPGGYLAKAGMPAFVIMVALIFGRNRVLAASATATTIINFGVSFLAGERVNFLLRFFSAALALFAWRFHKFRASMVLVFCGIGIATAFLLGPENAGRLTHGLYEGISTGFQSDYFSVMGGGYAVFEQAMTLGIGPGNYRMLAEGMLADMPHLRADNHPHNFYLQLLAETGIVGTITGIFFMVSIIWTCFMARSKEPGNIVVTTAFIVPLGMFWPIATTADFFGQWNNIFMWSAVATALACARAGSKDNSQKVA